MKYEGYKDENCKEIKLKHSIIVKIDGLPFVLNKDGTLWAHKNTVEKVFGEEIEDGDVELLDNA